MGALDILSDTNMDVQVFIGETRSTIKELQNLKYGSFFYLNKLAGELLDISVNNKIIATGEMVVIDGYLGIRVIEIFFEENQRVTLPKTKKPVKSQVLSKHSEDTVEKLNNEEHKSHPVLSESEIDQLLNAIATGNDDAKEYKAEPKKIRILDFCHKGYFSTCALDDLRETMIYFSRFLSTCFNNITFQLESIDEHNYFSYEKGGYDFDSIYQDYELIDQRYWDNSVVSLAASKSLVEYFHDCDDVKTGFEKNLSNPIYENLAAEIGNWGNNIPISITSNHIVNNPKFLEFSVDPKIEIVFHVLIDNDKKTEGDIKLILPSKKVKKYLYNFGIQEEKPVIENKSINSIPVELKVLAGSTKLPLEKINNISEGTIIEIDRLLNEPFDLLANGVLVAKGDIGVHDEFFTFEVNEII